MRNHLLQHRKLLDDILDQLIPVNSAKSIPAAGSIGVGDYIEACAAEDEAVFDALNQMLLSAARMRVDVSPELVKKLEEDDIVNFTLLLKLTYMGYYSRPEIRSLVGVGSWPVHPRGYEVPLEPIDTIEKLTAPVKERGAIYRSPDNTKQVSSE